MSQPLPSFRFHPDPLQSGSIEPSPKPCGCCGQARGYVYTGPCYVEDDFDTELCPWCIADGKAHRRFGVTFHELEPGPGIDTAIADEIEERTPGFATFNPVAWPSCCGGPMAYLEPAGHTELKARHAELLGRLVPSLEAAMRLPRADAERLVDSLQRDHSPCAHVFRCAECRTSRAEIDFD